MFISTLIVDLFCSAYLTILDISFMWTFVSLCLYVHCVSIHRGDLCLPHYNCMFWVNTFFVFSFSSFSSLTVQSILTPLNYSVGVYGLISLWILLNEVRFKNITYFIAVTFLRFLFLGLFSTHHILLTTLSTYTHSFQLSLWIKSFFVSFWGT